MLPRLRLIQALRFFETLDAPLRGNDWQPGATRSGRRVGCQHPARIGRNGASEKIGSGGPFEQASAVHDPNAVADLRNHAEVVSDEHDSRAVLAAELVAKLT